VDLKIMTNRKRSISKTTDRTRKLLLEPLEQRLPMAAALDATPVSAPPSSLSAPTAETSTFFASSSSELPDLGLPSLIQLSGDSSTMYPSYVYTFPEARDLSVGDGLGVDVFNTSNVVARLAVSIRASNGQVHTLAKNVQPYAHVKLGAQFFQGSIRVFGLPFSEPDVRWMDSNPNDANVKSVKSIQFFLDRPGASTAVEITNVRLLKHISLEQPIMDQFGQYTGKDWPGKASDMEEYRAMVEQDIAARKDVILPSNRDAFGGLLDSGIDFGNAVPAGGTGFFTTAKDTTGRWWLVTPVGNPFFSVGVDAATSTGPTRVRGREYLFDPATPVDADGNTDFYAQNIQRYNEIAGPDASWQERTLERLADWGFNTVGNWADEELTAPVEGAPRVPYIRTVVRKRLLPMPTSGGAQPPTIAFPGTNFSVPAFYTSNWRWPFPDVFSQQFIDYTTKDTVNVQVGTNTDGTPLYETIPAYFGVPEVARVSTDPYAIGFFVDNEIHWDGGERAENVAIPRMALNLIGSDVRARFLQELSAKYDSAGSLMRAWNITFSPALANPDATPLSEIGTAKLVFPTTLSATAQRDLNELLGIYADQYYRTVREGFKAHMPNTLYLGSRLYQGSAPAPVMQAMAKYVDVISMNMYRQPGDLSKLSWQSYEQYDKPLFLSEFGFVATDLGHFVGKHYNTDESTQADRGIAYQRSMDLIASNPLFVGTSVFEYVDHPPTGRAVGYENYNWGLVNELDLPNTDYVNRVSQWNTMVYEKRLGTAPANNAPSLNNTNTPARSVQIDDRNSYGTPIWVLLGGSNDTDAHAERGIAVTALTGTENGNWQYTFDGGASWFDFRNISLTAARLLPSSGEFTRIRFQPNSGFLGTVKITYRAWDQTQGYETSPFNLSGDGKVGGSAAFSMEERTSSLDVLPPNIAPKLDPSVAVNLLPINEDNRNSYGTPVWMLLPAVSDANPGAKRGVAITSSGSANGFWQYTLDGGTTWKPIGALTAASALLLPANGNHSRVRFIPKPDFSGSAQLGFYAWDQTQGQAGGTFDLTGSDKIGGATAFSANYRVSTLAVLPINDAPKLNPAMTPSLGTLNEDNRRSYGTPIWQLTSGMSDVDANAKRGIAISAADGTNGLWQFTLDGGKTWNALGTPSLAATVLLPTNGNLSRIRFLPNANFNGTVELKYFAWDQTQGTAGGTSDLSGRGKTGNATAFSVDSRVSRLSVLPLNDVPVLNVGGSTGYKLNGPAILLAEGATVTDVDSPNFANGYLLLSITSGADASNRLAIGGTFTLAQQGNAMRVMLGNTVIGTLTSDGSGTQDLLINFNANVTPVIAQQLLRSITFRTVDSTSTAPPSRIVKITLSDGQGTSAVKSRTVKVSL
jgi:hypothetical protein